MVLSDGPYVVGDVELLGDVAQVVVVADDAGNVDGPLAGLVAGEQVVEAVTHAADEDGHAGAYVVEVEAEGHVVAWGVECGDVLADLVARDEECVELPFYSHEEDAVLAVDVLVEVDDVALVVRNELGDVGYDALPVGAVEQQDGRRFHVVCVSFCLCLLS